MYTYSNQRRFPGARFLDRKPGLGLGQKSFGLRLAGAARRGLELMLLWQDRVSQRSRLARLEACYLDDMGLSREDVAAEVAKPFWRA